MKRLIDNIKGHAWTIAPTVRHRVAPLALPPAVSWHTRVDGPSGREVVVRGLHTDRDSDTLVVLIHGLGGNPESAYLRPVTRALDERGWSTLRLALRGTEGIGNDFYHAGLTDDPHAVFADAAFDDYERIFVVGFSLGGHIAIRLATEIETDARVHAVVGVCPPIDLEASARAIDSRERFGYRQYVLGELKTMYRRLIDAGVDVPSPWTRVRMTRTIREWDALTVVPRFGFGTVDNYYRTAGVAHRLDQVTRPALMVHSRHDPMIPPHTIDPALATASDLFEPRWFDGAGHTFFPATLDLGEDAGLGLGAQLAAWLERRSAER